MYGTQKKRLPFRVSFNAPAVLGFSAACVAAQLLNLLTGGGANRLVFSVYRSSLLDPLAYVRLVCHVLGHADWQHLIGNLMYLLILGPMLEEKYGSRSLLIVIGTTAVVTGLVNMLFFPGVRLLGASGVVFAMILLASITTRGGDHAIPVTFILVALLYLGQQVADGLFRADQISQMAHIIGGAVGSVLGFAMNRISVGKR